MEGTELIIPHKPSRCKPFSRDRCLMFTMESETRCARCKGLLRLLAYVRCMRLLRLHDELMMSCLRLHDELMMSSVSNPGFFWCLQTEIVLE